MRKEVIKKIRLSLLGATGSIGKSAISLIDAFPEHFEVKALSCAKNYIGLYPLIKRFKPELVSVQSSAEKDALAKLLKKDGQQVEIMTGENSLADLATMNDTDVTLIAVSGAVGLIPTLAALKAQKKVALANKESLVIGGELLKKRDLDLIIPVDSEHSAIFQALGGTRKSKKLERLILTASGGPFRGYSYQQIMKVTLEDALKHPNWKMGPKITVDSATLLNKGFEIIEAHHLFNMPISKISVVIHPQSIIHSLIEYQDGSMIAQLGPTDMRQAIAYALTHPLRLPLLENPKLENFKPFTFNKDLTFEEPDRHVFRALLLAEEVGQVGGTLPAVLNAAGEVAVWAFLRKQIPFYKITDIMDECLEHHFYNRLQTIEDVLEADRNTRRFATKLLTKKKYSF
jgi:1-deoxy-D-xylulose-5-phosphate reductoisomerase